MTTGAFRKLLQPAAVSVDYPKLIVSRTTGRENDAFAVGRPARPSVVSVIIFGEVSQVRAVSADYEDVALLPP